MSKTSRRYDHTHFLIPTFILCLEILLTLVKFLSFQQHIKTKVNKGKVSATARFKEDLDLDSLDAVEVVMACEDEFVIEIPDSEADKFFAINDVTDFIANHPMAK